MLPQLGARHAPREAARACFPLQKCIRLRIVARRLLHRPDLVRKPAPEASAANRARDARWPIGLKVACVN